MKTFSPAAGRAASPAGPPAGALAERLGALYELAQRSAHVFGSPLGPFRLGGRELALPRFVYFGPHTSQESLRLAVLSGCTRHERTAAQALLGVIESLARAADIGQSLNVSFFPVVNVGALLADQEERDLGAENWVRSAAPEIALLNQDARRCGYAGFMRVTSSLESEPAAWVRSVRPTTAHPAAIELFAAADFAPWPVQFETVAAESVAHGPLTLADDLPFAPFEVELALPADWPPRRAEAELGPLLKRLIVRYRAFLAYGQHL
jgi:hypothetical protein